MIEHNGYLIKSAPMSPNLKVIVTAGKGGTIPNTLRGMQLNATSCMKLIDKYLTEKKPNAKAKPTSSKL